MTTMLLKYREVDFERPQHFDDSNWEGLLLEQQRFDRAVLAEDLGDVVGSLKTMIESISKTVLELGGKPRTTKRHFPPFFNQRTPNCSINRLKGTTLGVPPEMFLSRQGR